VTRQTWIIAVLVLGMISGSAWYLRNQQSRQKLGQPGIRTTDEAVYAHDGLSTNAPTFVSSNRVYLPPEVLDYKSEQGIVHALTVQVLPKDTVFGRRTYANSRRLIDYQVILMGSDRSSIHRPEFCLNGSGFEIISGEHHAVRITKPQAYDLPVRRLNLRRMREDNGVSKMQSAVFVYWLVADNKFSSKEFQRMWWMARDLLTTGVMQRWAYVICYSPCEPGREDETFGELKEFITASAPEFHLAVGPRVRGAQAAANSLRDSD